MMRVTFYDVRRETYETVSNVEQLQSCQFRISGRLCNVWYLHMEGTGQKTYAQRWYQIHRIELQGGIAP